MSSRGSRCSAATTDVRRPPRSRAPICACSPISCRSRSSDARTSAATSCTSCCASTRPRSSQPNRPTRSRRPASAMRATTSECWTSAGRRSSARASCRRATSYDASSTTCGSRPSGPSPTWARGRGAGACWRASTSSSSRTAGSTVRETFERLASVAGDLDRARARRARGGRVPHLPRAARSATTRSSTGSPLECLPGLREHQMTWELSACLLALGINACYRDVYPEAAAYLEEAVATARSAGDGIGEVATRSRGSASCSCCMDDLERREGFLRGVPRDGRGSGQPAVPRVRARASSASSRTPRSATRTRCACTWRRTSSSPVSGTSAAPATR